MAAQVQTSIVVSRPEPVEKVEIEILASHSAGDIRCSSLNASAVRRYNCNTTVLARKSNDPVVRPFSLVLRQVGEAAVGGRVRAAHASLERATPHAILQAASFLRSASVVDVHALIHTTPPSLIKSCAASIEP